MPDKMSREKIDLLRAYGAEVVLAPTDVAPDSPQSYYRVADRLTEEIPGAFQPNQYFNQANPQAHYESTGPELWEQTGGRITHLVVGVGTGGTVTGTGALPAASATRTSWWSAPTPRARSTPAARTTCARTWSRASARTSGPRRSTRPSSTAGSRVSDRDSFLTTRRLAQAEGILAGGSGGLALHAALEVAGEIDDPDALVVVDPPRRRALLPVEDLQRRLDAPVRLPRARGSTLTVGDVLRAQARRAARSRRWSRSRPTTRCATRSRCCTSTASRSCRSSAPHDPPTVVGAIGERGLLKRAAEDPSLLDAEIVDVMEPPFPAVSADDPVREAVELLVGDQQALLVTRDGRAERARHARRPAGSIGFVTERSRAPRDAFATRAVHAGLTPDPRYGSVIPAIHQTSTYAQRAAGRVRRGLRLRPLGQPDPSALEQALGELEGGLAVAFSSGLAAEHALITVACEAGSHVVLPADLYGGTYRLVDKVLAAGAWSYDLVDQTDLDALERAVRDETRLIWVETPTNPLLNVVDIEGVVARAAATRWSRSTTRSPRPVNQRPLELGADFVVHSTTKYLGGHSDVVGGAVIAARPRAHERLRFVQNAVGAVPGPVRLLPRAPRAAHAAPADGRPRAQRRARSSSCCAAPTA